MLQLRTNPSLSPHINFYPRGASDARVLAVVVCLSVSVCVSVTRGRITGKAEQGIDRFRRRRRRDRDAKGIEGMGNGEGYPPPQLTMGSGVAS